MLDSLREKGSPLLIVELGDFLEADSLKGSIINPFLLDLMEGEGMRAMIPGVLELSHWLRFQELMTGRSIEVICSNLRIRGGAGLMPLARRSMVVDVGGVQVALLGVIGSEEYGEVRPPEGVEFDFQDPAEAVAELMEDLRGACDLVAVMACMGNREAWGFARSLTGVDVVLGGHASVASDRPLAAGNVIVSRCGLRGQYLATTRLIVSPAGEIIDWGGRNYKLNEKVPSDPWIESMVEEKTSEAMRLKRRGPHAQARSGSKPAEPRKDRPAYLGGETCRKCHVAQYDHWTHTPHAGAWTRWIQQGNSEKLDELQRRVTGFGSAGGFGPEGRRVDLRNVQCEACHGPGSEHARGSGARPVNEATCRKCHTAQWSPHWRFKDAMRLVRH